MKKIYLTYLSLGLLLAVSSCNIEQPSLDVSQEPKTLAEIVAESNGSENLRKSSSGIKYQEKFSNKIQIVPDIDNGWTTSFPFPAWYPTTGVGNSTYLGKAYSFVNQYAYFDTELGFPVTIGAPLNDDKDILELMQELGISQISDEVHSLTTDGKGNSIFFRNLLNRTTPISNTRINFQADVAIIGGTGIFSSATGSGTVEGFFNPGTNLGETTLRASIKF